MDNNQQMNKKEQEQQSAEKLGKTVSRGAFDYATGGQWEKVRNAPVVGKIAQKAEDKTAKKFAKSPGGKATKKLAKKLDDAGVVDGVNKGLNAFGGSKAKSSPSSNPNINRTNNNIPNRSLENNPNSANTPRKNFAKNGLTDEGQEIPGLDNKEGAMRKSFDDIQKRRESSNKDNSSSSDTSQRRKPFNNPFKLGGKRGAFISVEIDNLVKRVVLPFACFLIFIFLAVIASADDTANDNDLSAVDEQKYEETGEKEAYYSSGDPQLVAFYKRVKETKENYSKDGKSINSMYITATYHILEGYREETKVKDIDQAALSFAMTIHSLMDYQLDMIGAGNEFNIDFLNDYIHWFSNEFGGQNEKNIN